MFDFTPLLLWGRSYLNCNFDVKYWNPYLIGYGPLQINRELNEASNLVPINTGIAVYKNWAQNTNIPIPLHPHAYNLSYWCQKKNIRTWFHFLASLYHPTTLKSNTHNRNEKHPQKGWKIHLILAISSWKSFNYFLI